MHAQRLGHDGATGENQPCVLLWEGEQLWAEVPWGLHVRARGCAFRPSL
jgi:hypothetical protein